MVPTGRGFEWFVAWRYLRSSAKESRWGTLIVALLLAIVAAIAFTLAARTRPLSPIELATGVTNWRQTYQLAGVLATALATLTGVFGYIHRLQSIFTTISTYGVFLGTAALVIVLSVMNGFEVDLRKKILGASAHVLVSKEDGPFTEWREIRDRLEGVPGVVAHTPYVSSEVVIAGSSNYAGAIIKGIDPESIARVTDLERNLEKGSRLEQMWPILPGGGIGRYEPGDPDGPGGEGASGADGGVGGPDLVPDEEPIDYSDDGPDEDGGAAGGPEPGGEGEDLVPDEAPIDYSDGPDTADEDAARAADDSADGTADEDAARAADDGADGTADDGADGTADDGADGAPDEARPGGDLLRLPTDDVRAPLPAGDDAGDDADDDAGADPGADAPPADGPRDRHQRLCHLLEDLRLRHDGLLDRMLEPLARGCRRPDPRVASLDGVLVGRELARSLHLYVDQEVQIVSPIGEDTPAGPVPRAGRFRVAGKFYSGMYEYDTKFVYVTLPALQRFLALGDEVSGIEVKVTDIEDTGPVVAAIQRRLGPGYRVQDWKELNRNLFSALKLEKIAMFLILTIIILVASFSIVSNLIMIVVEKGKEIAILKSMGASDRGVMRIFMIEGLYIGLMGTALGLIVGIGSCFALMRFGLPLDPNVYYIDKLPVAMEPVAIALVALAGVAISFVATIYPAYVAARLRPVDGLRYE